MQLEYEIDFTPFIIERDLDAYEVEVRCTINRQIEQCFAQRYKELDEQYEIFEQRYKELERLEYDLQEDLDIIGFVADTSRGKIKRKGYSALEEALRPEEDITT